MEGGSLPRSTKVVDHETFFQQYSALKEDYESLRTRYGDLHTSHSATVHKLELAQAEILRCKKLYEDAVQETSNAIGERNRLNKQFQNCFEQWQATICEKNEYQQALQKVQQRHEEAMKEVNKAVALGLKMSKENQKLSQERDAAVNEYHLIMGERDTVHRELEKLTEDLSQSKKELKRVETRNKELTEKIQEVLQENELSKRRRDWAFQERDKIVQERESLRILCDKLRRERDRAVSDLAEALSESEDIRKEKNFTSKQLKELKDKIEIEKENRYGKGNSNSYNISSSSFSQSRDSAIDSDVARSSAKSQSGISSYGASSSGAELYNIFHGGRNTLSLEKEKATLQSLDLEREGPSRASGSSPASTGFRRIRSKKHGKKSSSSAANSSGDNNDSRLTKTGTWPRMMLPPNLYSLPHDDVSSEQENVKQQSKTNVVSDNVGDGHHEYLRTNKQYNVVPSYYRNTLGVFDPSSLRNKLGKSTPDRNSVVPTLGLSNSSSIDLSVQSEKDLQILKYYQERMVKNPPSQGNITSSESDHLDAVVVTPPSFAMPNVPLSSSSNFVTTTSTLDRHKNPYSGYSSTGHFHRNPNMSPLPLSFPPKIATPDNSFAFKPTAYNNRHSHHPSSSTESTNWLQNLGFTHPSTSSSHNRSKFNTSDDLLLYHHPSGHHNYSSDAIGTFPRNKDPPRILFPSNQSVTSKSSTERFDQRNSPMPAITIDVTVVDAHGRVIEQPPLKTNGSVQKPEVGQYRRITIQKTDTQEPLGIKICGNANNNGGIFVSSVSANSLAYQCGLQVGDQLLDYCGINLRSATFELAQSVMGQCCKDSVTMLIQYCPDKYLGNNNGNSYDNVSSLKSDSRHSDNSEGSHGHTNDSNLSMSEDNDSKSDSPTPCNSAQSTLVRRRSSKRKSIIQQQQPQGVIGLPYMQPQQSQFQQSFAQKMSSSTYDNPGSEQSTLRSIRSGGGGNNESLDGKMMPRLLSLDLQKNSANLGLSLVGGNAVGIFVHSVQPDSVAYRVGIKTGDQILEYNGTSLRNATAEEAAFELAKPLDKVGILVQYNLQRYDEIKDKPGDGFYIRALFDYLPASGESQHSLDQQQLSFQKDEILYVDNTMFKGKPGRWKAWKVDEEGRQQQIWGVIPSKFKVEEDLLFKRNLGDLDGDRKSSTINRRSFFRRKSHHRSESRELASFSDFSVNSYSDLSSQLGGLQIKDESANVAMCSYQRVERLDYTCFLRPVIILGAFSDLIAERLALDFSRTFERASVEMMSCSGSMVEKGLAENIFVDYKRKGSHYECVTMGSIKEISAKKLHCIIDISTAGVERLQRAQMYPIVILVRFKSAKQIREIKDLRCDKITPKASKELYEHAQKVESEYKHLITASIPGGTNISYLATQVKAMVEQEQTKTLWVPMQL